jgi:hypothetical protein
LKFVSINFVFYESLEINDVRYSINDENSYKNKFGNSVIKHKNSYGIIKYIFKLDNVVYIAFRQLIYLCNNFYNLNFKTMKSKFSLFSLASTYMLVRQDEFLLLKKLFFFINH